MVKLLDRLFKKPWHREACTFVLQEYGRVGGKGWVDVTKPVGEVPSKAEAMEHVKPGHHYRVMARYISGDRAGQLAGVVWSHYEKLPGGLEEKEKPKTVRKVVKRVSPSEVLEEYVDEVDRVLKPIARLSEVFATIRESFGAGQVQQQMQGGQSQLSPYGIPPPEFEGKAPWFLNPWIVHYFGEEVKGIIEYGADRMEGIFGRRVPTEAPVEEEEEEFTLPMLPTEEVEEEVLEEELVEEEPVEEEEAIEEVPTEIEVEEPTEEEEIEGLETVPGLVEKEPIMESMQSPEERERIARRIEEEEKDESKTE